jgi:hypothetical protein
MKKILLSCFLVIQSAAGVFAADVVVDSFTTSQTWDNFGISVVASGDGFGVFTGVESNANFADYFLATPINIGSNNAISVYVKLTGSNTGANFAVTFGNDVASKYATAVFSTASLNVNTYTLLSTTYVADAGFSPSVVDMIRVSGVSGGGTLSLGVSIDYISAVTVSAVPEPATYAAIFGLAALGFGAVRRRRKA